MLDLRSCTRALRSLAFAAATLLTFSSSVLAQTPTVMWNANSEADLSGYILQYGTQAGNPTNSTDVGNVTSRQVAGLAAGQTYYFRVVAYNATGQSSGPSTEVSYVVPGTPNPTVTLTSVSPTSGPVAGGTVLTLTGTNFVSGSTVQVGGVAATGVTFVSATQLRATTPAGTAGARAVQVTTPGGQSASLASAFTYTASTSLPTITSVTPSSGPTAGGTSITIRGANYVLGAGGEVRVGGVMCPSISFISSSELRCTTPAGAAGAQPVYIRNPNGDTVTAAGGFTYVAPTPAPALTSITPTSGSTAGGTTITLTGANFVSGATVRVAGVAATGVTFVSATQLRATTPAGTAGAAAVQVTNPDGQNVTLASAFTYQASAPTLTSIAPTSGPTAGGTTITLNGTNFVSGATVRVGNTAATAVTFVSATQLRANTPAGTGSAAVQVTNPDGQTVSLANAFTYQAPAPTLTSIAPTSGTTAGGTTITITGTNFVSGATVRVGSTAATAVTFVSATQLRANTPAGSGVAAVQVTNPDGQSVTLASAFTYQASAPTLTSIAPTSGPTAGGTTITITGTNFVSGATVRVGSTAATAVTFVSATQLRANTPAGSGSAAVQVTNPDGQTASLASAFTYATAAPTLTSVSPNSGSRNGGTQITLTGSNFVSGATVRINNVAATGVTFVSATQLRATTPAGTAGARPVQVTNPDGQSVTLASGFTYTTQAAPPVITSVSPSSGISSGGTVVTITGQNFVQGGNGDIRIAGTSLRQIAYVNATTLRGTTRGGPVGAQDVWVRNPDGQTVTLTRGFTYTSSQSASSRSIESNALRSTPVDPTVGEPVRRYLAEGVQTTDMSTRIAIANPQSSAASVVLTFADAAGRTTAVPVAVPPRARRTVDLSTIGALAGASFSTTVDADAPVAVDRLVSWDARGVSASLESAVEQPATRWYFAEGSTTDPFELFYLVQNPNATAAQVQVRYLLTQGQPVTKTYTVPAGARATIWVDREDAALANADVAADITSTNGVPVVVERSLYLSEAGAAAPRGGDTAAGATALSTTWVVRGSTGDRALRLALANPGATPAAVSATYVTDAGARIVKTYAVAAYGRTTVNVAGEDAALANADVTVSLESATPIVAERTIGWGANGGWDELLSGAAIADGAARWLLAEGEQGGARQAATSLVVLNRQATAADVTVTLLFEDAPEVSAVFTVDANGQLTVPVAESFPTADGKRFSVLVEATDPSASIAVDRAITWRVDGANRTAGADGAATKLR